MILVPLLGAWTKLKHTCQGCGEVAQFGALVRPNGNGYNVDQMAIIKGEENETRMGI